MCLCLALTTADPAKQGEVLDQALQKLNMAKSMDVTSTKAMNAIGDVYVLRSENTLLPLEQRAKCLQDALALG